MVRGVRSVGPSEEETQVIRFLDPLTIISGPNGSGKTTLIEALNYVTTGALPAGKLASFVHSLEASNKPRVDGMVKLQFKDCKGRVCVATKRVNATMKKLTRFVKALDVMKKMKKDYYLQQRDSCEQLRKESKEKISALEEKVKECGSVIAKANEELVKLEALERKAEVKRAELHVLKDQLTRIRVSPYPGSESELRAEIREMDSSSEFRELEAQRDRLKMKIDSISKDIMRIKREKDEAECEMRKVMSCEMESSASEREKEQTRLDVAQMKCTKLSCEMESASSAMETLNREIKTVERKLQDAAVSSNDASVNSSLKSGEESNKVIENDLKRCERDLDRASQSLKQSSAEEEKLINEVEQLRKKIFDLLDMSLSMPDDIERLEKQVAEAEERERKLASAVVYVDQCKKIMEEKVRQVRKQMSESRKEEAALTTKVGELRDAMEKALITHRKLLEIKVAFSRNFEQGVPLDSAPPPKTTENLRNPPFSQFFL
ncbi:hypothetical protein ANCCEY_02298 [Ancylostoma ceylanicum]|uniref:Rad50/SbcC-type AAA domain-containing protein n=1 Tax=Ancylostoma ceylanicum TaxID=53326 RepID=A0A0D6M330_9BILA|nr:hypothetical protein ANCCEY_02298 [Ancylostoma ceylanicum]